MIVRGRSGHATAGPPAWRGHEKGAMGSNTRSSPRACGERWARAPYIGSGATMTPAPGCMRERWGAARLVIAVLATACLGEGAPVEEAWVVRYDGPARPHRDTPSRGRRSPPSPLPIVLACTPARGSWSQRIQDTEPLPTSPHTLVEKNAYCCPLHLSLSTPSWWSGSRVTGSAPHKHRAESEAGPEPCCV